MHLLEVWLFVGGILLGMILGRRAKRAERTTEVVPDPLAFTTQLINLQTGLRRAASTASASAAWRPEAVAPGADSPLAIVH